MAKRKILVVVDMQNDFISGVLGNAECQGVVAEVVKLIEDKEYSALVVTQDTHFENYLDTQEGKKLPVVHCIKGTDGWKLNETVQKAIESRKDIKLSTIEKNTFGSLAFANLLRDKFLDYDEIHFCGVCTGICVISNVMLAKASLVEAKIVVVEKACACVTPESHKTALEAMKMCHIEVI